jgi:hypothetical protein
VEAEQFLYFDLLGGYGSAIVGGYPFNVVSKEAARQVERQGAVLRLWRILALGTTALSSSVVQLPAVSVCRF